MESTLDRFDQLADFVMSGAEIKDDSLTRLARALDHPLAVAELEDEVETWVDVMGNLLGPGQDIPRNVAEAIKLREKREHEVDMFRRYLTAANCEASHYKAENQRLEGVRKVQASAIRSARGSANAWRWVTVLSFAANVGFLGMALGWWG